VLGFTGLGLALIVAFVFHSFRPEHPLLDLRLFRNKNLTWATITMFIFAGAFFGGLLLVPTYLQTVRGEGALDAGLLVAPQGIGAMLTMPIAGALADKLPVGRIVPFGLATITAGMFGLTQVDGDTSYWGYLIPVLFVMGLGMGATMMPLMTSAIKTLTAHQVARGSTLLNISQQVASSIGVAIISVVLTNGLRNDPLVSQAQAFGEASAKDPANTPSLLQQFPLVGEILGRFGSDAAAGQAALQSAVQNAMGEVFGSTFLVAAIMVAFTLVSAAFLPRKHERSHLLDDEDAASVAPPVVLH
jgi:nitrate/nitrite transporter NarK